MENPLTAAATVAESALKPFSEGTVKFFGLLLKPGAEQLGSWLGDRIQFARQRNIEKLAAKTKAKLEAAGIEPQPVPTKTLLMVMQNCAVEDEDEMVERWANLLAAAASGCRVLPSYVQTLSNLSPDEARLLSLLKRSQRAGTVPVFAVVECLETEDLKKDSALDDETFYPCLTSLIRLGLVAMPDIGDSSLSSTLIATTPYAENFLSACSSAHLRR